MHCYCSTSVTCRDFISLKTASGRWWRLLLWSMRSSTFFSPASDLSWIPLMLLNLQEHRNHSHINKSTDIFTFYSHLCMLIWMLPQVYSTCVCGQARRNGEQGAKGTMDFIGLVTVTAPGAGLAHGQSECQHQESERCYQHTRALTHFHSSGGEAAL